MKARNTRNDKQPEPVAGKTRWERMERNTLTLELLLEAHSAAYLAENKSQRTVEWHNAAVTRYARWVRRDLY